MRSVRLRAAVALSAFLFGLTLDAFVNTSSSVEKALSYPVKAVDSVIGLPVEVPRRAVTFDPSVPTAIMFERLQPTCFSCDPKKIFLYTEGSGEMLEQAVVIETNLRTGLVRHGKLDSYFYRNLISFIVGQGYFEISERYVIDIPPERGTIRTPVLKSAVMLGDRYKNISTANEGQLPSALWGIHYAIEGVLFHVQWEN